MQTQGNPVMSESVLVERERALLARLFALVVERAAAEVQVELDFQTRNETNKRECERLRKEILSRFQAARTSLDNDYQGIRRRIKDRYRAQKSAAEKEFTDTRDETERRYALVRNKAKNEAQESRWTTAAIFDAGKAGAERQFKE